MAYDSILQATKARLLDCTISGISYHSQEFHVQELRVYEDICKTYFTGQLVIEAQQNTFELYLNPGALVVLSFDAPRSDGGRTKQYTERFVVYSYESKPREGDIVSSMVITISLVGQEFYNDKNNTVLKSIANKTGTAAAAEIHDTYIAQNGTLQIPLESLGMIGMDLVPHEVNNKKPVKAIHDILDKVVYQIYKTCAVTYFRNKPGYVMAPLQYLLEKGPQANTEIFVHDMAIGTKLGSVLMGYNKILQLRPMSPPGENTGSVRAADVDGIFKSLAFFDVKSGNYNTNPMSAAQALSLSFGGFKKLVDSLKLAVKSRYGGRQIFAMIDDYHQSRSVAKNGPGGYEASEQAFLASLTYSPKYWVSVPLQTGLNVTCGQRINIQYPFGGAGVIQKTLFVPRLIHELRFTEGPNRDTVTVTGTTDIYGVHWGE